MCVCLKIFKNFGHTMQHVGSSVPHQGSNLCPLQWNCEVLTSRLPENFQNISNFHRENWGERKVSVSIRKVNK